MNKLEQLKEIKRMRSQLINVMDVYSKDMKNLLLDLYKTTPTPSYEFDINEDELRKVSTSDFMLKILKKLCNSDLSKEYIAYSKKVGFDREYQHAYKNLLSRISFIGRQLNYNVYGDNHFIKKYLPDLDSVIYELITIWIYSNMNHDPNLKDKLFKSRFNYISEYIWNIHAIDEASKAFLFPNYDTLTNVLIDDGYNDQIRSLYDLRTRNNNINIYGLNSYILGNILLGYYLRDPYVYNKIVQEIHTTDNDNYEEVLNNLGINYVKHDDIIKSLRIPRDDNHGTN